MKHSERRKIAVIADDFTGALDTGVQFAKRGAKTVTIFDVEKTEQKMAEDDADVYVIDAESRHLEERQAYALVYRIAAVCRRQGTDYIYKKTDSVLRGNIETEIMAVRDAFGGGRVSFLPAYPKMQRYTIDGIQYLGEQPVNETASGKDPFEPVESAVVARLFHRLKTENRKASGGRGLLRRL